MSGCVTCGRPTPRRKCRTCEIEARAEERAETSEHDHAECPSCGKTTSREDVKCYRCRRGDGVETDGGSIRGLEAADDIERHLQGVIDEADNQEAHRHAREALQQLAREGGR